MTSLYAIQLNDTINLLAWCLVLCRFKIKATIIILTF